MQLKPTVVVDDAAFATAMARLGPFEPRPDVAVALSGGRDSMLLCQLAKRWADAQQGTLLALIVDHGLRSESTSEALAVAKRCDGNGIAAEVLNWFGPKPSTGVQQKARDARYKLLEAACRKRGILHLLLGHHADDQAETVAMRRARNSGAVGRAGMASIVERSDVRLLRPLLSFTRADIDATVRALKLDFVDDPSNKDSRFWRAQYRVSHSGESDSPADAAARNRLLHRIDRWASAHLQWHPLGPTLIDRDALDELDSSDRSILLGRVIRSVGGAAYTPRRDRLTGLVGSLASEGVRTVGGTVVVVAGRSVMITREPRAIVDVVKVAPGTSQRWDGRFLVTNNSRRAITAGPTVPWPQGFVRPNLRLPRPAVCLAGLPALVAADDVLAVGPFDADGCQCDILVHACASAPFSEAPYVV